MSRRPPPSDAFTRFTSTAPPSAQPQSSSPSFTSSQRNPQSSRQTTPSFQPRRSPPQSSSPSPSPQEAAPPNETPAEKVARLRTQARLRAAQNANLSPIDRMIDRGRIWADTAHRVTTYSLLAITGVSAVFAAYSLVSLVSHNRRQKRAWIEREMDRLAEAQRAFLRGEANAEQLHLLEQERAGEEIAQKFKDDKARKKAQGYWAQVKGMFGSGDRGLESERLAAGGSTAGRVVDGVDRLDKMVETRGSAAKDKLLEEGWVEGQVTVKPVAVKQSGIEGVGLDEKGRPVPINKMQRVVETSRRSGEKEIESRTGIVGGPLDVLADNITQKGEATAKSWLGAWWK